MSIRTKPTAEATIENLGATASNVDFNLPKGRDDEGNDIAEDGVRIGTPTAEEDAHNVRVVMDAITFLFTDHEERTSARTGEVYVANKREFPGKMMLRQFVRQFDFDLKGLKDRIATEENNLARVNRRVSADPRELVRIEQRIEGMVDAYCERTAMRREAASYYADLTGEHFDTPVEGAKAGPKAEPEVSDADKRRAERAKLLGL